MTLDVRESLKDIFYVDAELSLKVMENLKLLNFFSIYDYS